MAIPVIYKGDDTDFRGSSNLVIRLSSEIDLSGCYVEFTFLGQKRTFRGNACLSAIPFVFTAAETAMMPVGTHKARIRLIDSDGRVQTVDDSIRIRVTDNLKEAYGWDGEQEIAVKVQQRRTGEILAESDIFDCSVPMVELKERIAFLWERMGGSVANREALEF